MSYIYAIFENSTELPIYVGSTSTSLNNRFRLHLRDAFKRDSQAKIHEYIRSKASSMNDAKSVFNIQQLKECSELLAPDYEEFFTTKLRSDGYVLLNILKAAKSLQPIDTRNTPAVVDANTLFCRHCGCAKPKSEFHNKKSMTGKQSYCAECQIKLMSEYRRAKIVKSLKKIPSQYTPETVPLSKFCAKCKRVLQINKFYVCATHKDGFQSYCSSCCKKYDKQKQLAKKAQIESSINSASL